MEVACKNIKFVVWYWIVEFASDVFNKKCCKMKKIFVASIVTATILTLCFSRLFRETVYPPIKVEFKVEVPTDMTIDCYYTTNAEEGFSEAKVVRSNLLVPNVSNTVLFSIPESYVYSIRIDFNNTAESIVISDLSVSGLEKKRLRLSDISFQNDILSLTEEGERLSISINGLDSFVSFSAISVKSEEPYSVLNKFLVVLSFVFFLVVSLYFFIFKGKETKKESVLLKRKNRNVKYEFVRTTAAIFVICCHVLGFTYDSSAKSLSYDVLSLFFSCCNPLFFFLAGKFALNTTINSNDEYLTFYVKKIVYLFLPMLLYMFIQTIYQLWDSESSFGNIGYKYLLNILADFRGIHFWFLYVLVGNILISPFMSKIFEKTSDLGLIIFIGIVLFFNALSAYLPYFELYSKWTCPLAEWSIYFYIGGCIDRLSSTKKQKKVVLSLGIVSAILIILQKQYSMYSLGIHDIAVTYTFFSCMLYVLLRDVYSFCTVRIDGVWIFIGKYSFQIYLIHWLVLTNLTKEFPYEDCTFPYIVYFVLMLLATLIVSLLSSFVIQNIILNPTQKTMMFVLDVLFRKKE